MASQVSTDDDAAIVDFCAKMDECTMLAVCGRKYVLVKKLKTWLRSQVDGSLDDQAMRLLRYAFRDWQTPGLPGTYEHLIAGPRSCLVVFSILLKLGCPELVFELQRHEISDLKLPITEYDLRDKFLKMPNINDAPTLAAAFDDLQWRFCAAEFEFGVAMSYQRKYILPIPIYHKEKINDKGGTATLWHIAVQEEFVGEKLRQAVSRRRFSDDKVGWCYDFALKTYDESRVDNYKTESHAFYGLRGHPGMVQYLLDYSHVEMLRPSTIQQSAQDAEEEQILKATHNILLEYGECDLDEFFHDRLPPVLQIETEDFWKSLFEIADALERIHNLKVDTNGQIQEYHGWHADIKPDNILVVNEKFKLADPGFAIFIKKTSTEPKGFVLGGTETYGAPERHPGRRGTMIAVPQTIDIWSLGCVFSIAATWVVLGYQGVLLFSKMREKAVEAIIQGSRNQQLPPQRHPTLNPGNYFHDGRKVLNMVRDWHDMLAKTLRKTDTITSQVLEVVNNKMLRSKAEVRLTAVELCKELKQILSQSRAQPRSAIPEGIMEALLEVDEEAPSKVVQAQGQEADHPVGQNESGSYDRKARKKKLQGLPLMKTTHRSGYLKSELSNMASGAGGPSFDNARAFSDYRFRLPAVHELQIQPHVSAQLQQPLRKLETNNQAHPNLLHQESLSPSIPAEQPKRSKSESYQNIWQAREEIEKRERGNFLGQIRRDRRLTRHFLNRDILFLVDNAESMEENWYEATELLGTLVEKAAGQDENGMDLLFTLGPVHLESKKKKSDFKKAMNDDKARPMVGTRTNMKPSLGKIFDNYLDTWKNYKKNSLHRKEPKNLTLIILTDGIWASMQDKNEVGFKIVKFLKDLGKVNGDLQDRPMSIEFIQFGDDEEATQRLRRLDNDLKWEGIPDVVDTEQSTGGDINKMLLGSFVEEYDENEREEATSPESLTHQMPSSQSIHEMGIPTRQSSFHAVYTNRPIHESPSPHQPSRFRPPDDPQGGKRHGGY